MRKNEEDGLLALAIGLGIGIVYGLCCLLGDGDKKLNINVNTGPTRSERIRDFYQRRREAYLRMHREKFIVWSSDREEFQRRWKRKWIEEGFPAYSYDSMRSLDDIY